MLGIMSRTLCFLAVCLEISVSASAQNDSVRVPAEFEPVQAVLVQWSVGSDDGLYAFLVEHTRLAGATPYVVTVNDGEKRKIESYLNQRGISAQGVQFVVHPMNSAWIRDYGPVGYFNGNEPQVVLADFFYKPGQRPFDNRAPMMLGGNLQAQVNRIQNGTRPMILEGGDFLTDGFGTLFTATAVSSQNGGSRAATQAFSDSLGLENVHYLPCFDKRTHAHIDMHMKLLDEETILLGQLPEGSRDPLLSRTEQYVSKLRTCYGTPYRIVRVPFFAERGPRRTAVLYSYTNSLIVNNYVLVPTYGVPTDQQALQIYEQAMPGYRVVGYDCTASIRSGGAIHCLTREVPMNNVVRIGHPRFQRDYMAGETITFTADCWSQQPMDRVVLFVKQPGPGPMESYEMTRQNGSYTAQITALGPGELRYAMRADAGNVSGWKPQNGWDLGYLSVNIALPERSEVAQNLRLTQM
jgi:agmatine/peptidylarginine deiminase